MSDLKPCPFCGGEAQVLKDGLPYVVIECERCFCRTNCNVTEAEAIAAWNTRAECTCKIIEWHEARDRHEIGNNRVRFSCGDFGTCHDKFCPECGARVVS